MAFHHAPRRALVLGGFFLLALPTSVAAQVLRYGGRPGESRTYVREQRDRVVQMIEGRQATSEITSFWRLRTKLSARTPEALTIEVMHDSLAISGAPSIGSLDLASLHGVPVEVVLSPRGSVRDVELPADLPPDAARLDLETTYRAFFPRLPEGELGPGTAWSDTTMVTVHQNGLDLRVRRVNRYTSKGRASPGDERPLPLEGGDPGEGAPVRVDYELELVIEGEGEQQEAAIDLSGSGRGTGVFYFDPDAGAFAGGSESTEMRLVAFVTAPGDQTLLIPIVQSRTQTTTLVEVDNPTTSR